jgi:hypothetical protein
MSATLRLTCAATVAFWLMFVSAHSQESHPDVSMPTTIITDGAIKTENEGQTTVYLIDATKPQKSTTRVAIKGDFRILTNGTIRLAQDSTRRSHSEQGSCA